MSNPNRPDPNRTHTEAVEAVCEKCGGAGYKFGNAPCWACNASGRVAVPDSGGEQ